MRLIFKILSILLVIYVLSFLSVPLVKAGCRLLDGECFGDCSCAQVGKCGRCECKINIRGDCVANFSGCSSCGGGGGGGGGGTQPTNTLPPIASPTTKPGCDCGQYNGSCDKDSTPVCNCSKIPPQWQCTGTKGSCSQWSSWSDCYPPPACIQTRFCESGNAEPQAQKCCDYAGCCPDGGGSTALLGIRLLNPSLSPVSFPSVSLCKVNCKNSPCYALNCQKEVSSADFSGQINSKHGGAIHDPNKNLTILGITPIQNNEIFTGPHSFNCRNASITDIKDCYYWTSALQTGSRILYYIVAADIPTISLTPSPTPTPSENWVKLKDTSFYTPRLLAQNIPSSPLPFDSDDDASPYFITSSSGSDADVVAAPSLNLGLAGPHPGHFAKQTCSRLLVTCKQIDPLPGSLQPLGGRVYGDCFFRKGEYNLIVHMYSSRSDDGSCHRCLCSHGCHHQ